MDNNASVSAEEIIATLAFIVSVLAFIITVKAYRQTAKLSALSVFADTLVLPFQTLIEGMESEILDCFAGEVNGTARYDHSAMVELQIKFSKFMSEISYLSYAVPKQYKCLNQRVNDIVFFLDEMISRGGRVCVIRARLDKFWLQILIKNFFSEYFRFIRKGL